VDVNGWVVEDEREVTGTLREELFVGEDEEGPSLSSIAFAEKEARIRNGRTRKGPLEGPRGGESGAVWRLVEQEVRLEKEDERESESARGLLLESLEGSGP
jgi:hypothetical protein